MRLLPLLVLLAPVGLLSLLVPKLAVHHARCVPAHIRTDVTQSTLRPRTKKTSTSRPPSGAACGATVETQTSSPRCPPAASMGSSGSFPPPITGDELRQAARTFPAGTARGGDNVSPRAYSRLSPGLLDALAGLLTAAEAAASNITALSPPPPLQQLPQSPPPLP